ncbi:MAG: AhpC/TSA family protein [Bacteroidales bacterium]|nr:AhpC/TSA family protein [Bacteroidales bacterium]
MKKTALTTFITMVLLGCGGIAQGQKTIEIFGKIRGLGDESMVLRYRFDGTTYMDTITAKNDIISFKKEIELPRPIMATLTYIGAGQDALLITSTEFFIDNNVNIVLDGEFGDLYNLKATNSPFFDDVVKLREENREDFLWSTKLRAEVFELVAAGAGDRDEVKQWSEIQSRMANRQENFIKNNPNSVYAAYLFSLQLLRKTVDEIEEVFNRFTPEVQRSAFGEQIRTYLETAKKVAPGAVAPNFRQKDIDGNIVTLEQFRGKYVMLMFWGSWCGPCRRSHPHLMELLNAYKDSPLQVIGFASDRDRNAWKKAIEDDKLDFIHCNLFDKLDGEDVAALYNVRAFPTKVFIDPQGKIVKTSIGANEKELEELFETTFGQ